MDVLHNNTQQYRLAISIHHVAAPSKLWEFLGLAEAGKALEGLFLKLFGMKVIPVVCLKAID